jgi:DNA-binding CsgD family transcriptional regulator
MDLRRNSFVLSALSMGLIYISISFGLIVLNLRDSGKFDESFAAPAHFILALTGGLILYCTEKTRQNSSARLRLPAALTALVGLFCIVVPTLPGEWPLLIYNSRLPLISAGAGLFMGLGPALFFRTAPAGREGFFYGLIMAFGELLWVALFPLLPSGVDVDPAFGRRVFFHPVAFSCLAMGAAGLCLCAAFSLHGARDATQSALSPEEAPPVVFRGTRPALLWVFGAGLGLFTLIGLEMGMRLPKTVLAPGLVNLPHFLPLILLPPAGKMLDGEKPGRLIALLIPGCLFAPFLGLAQAKGLLDPLALFCLLITIRQALLLAVFTACARLMKTHALLPLLLSLAYCLHLMQFGGAWARGSLSASPHGVFMAALVLATGTAFCLWRFRVVLTKNPEIRALPGQAESPPVAESAPALSMNTFEHFANTHALTDREREILRGLIEGANLEALATSLSITLRTTRFHLTNLLNKTKTHNQRSLLSYYAVWKP